MSAVFAPVCSITPTRRRRFFWAAWWTEPPSHTPFRKPDAAAGGARSHAEALAQAEAAAGRKLVEIEGRWARAWSRVLVGDKPWTDREQKAPDPSPRPPRVSAAAPPSSIWHTLGLAPGANAAEIKRAFRDRALRVHPDQGGDPAEFRILRRAYDEALRRAERTASRPARRR